MSGGVDRRSVFLCNADFAGGSFVLHYVIFIKRSLYMIRDGCLIGCREGCLTLS